MAEASDEVGFLVVGTPRSGTTLVQRLAMELDDVGMPPETHFISYLGSTVPLRHAFPLDEVTLRQELEAFAALPSSSGLDIDVDQVAKSIGTSCPSLVAMFDALVAHLAGPAALLGEKTPGHLMWWRPLVRARPGLKFVAAVRDPRAVVASNLAAPWREFDRRSWGADQYLALAYDWSTQQRLVLDMARSLGSGRCLVLRYEDVVSDPPAARRRLSAFLGRGYEGAPAPEHEALVLPWETWKGNVVGPVTTDRVEAWRSVLTPDQAAHTVAICRREMAQFGYPVSRAEAVTARLRCARIPRRTRYRLRQYLEELAVEQQFIDDTRL